VHLYYLANARRNQLVMLDLTRVFDSTLFLFLFLILFYFFSLLPLSFNLGFFDPDQQHAHSDREQSHAPRHLWRLGLRAGTERTASLFLY
jgi:hypothetical protein